MRKASERQAKRNQKLAEIKPPADGKCEICHKLPDWRGLSRAHKRRRSDGRDDRRSNVVFACYPCHNGDTWEGGHKTEVKLKRGKPVDRVPELAGYNTRLRPCPKPGGKK